MHEHQIQRYSRQILLREVGGRGQTKLLTRAVEVSGQSSALTIAAEYLSAAGSPLRLTDVASLRGGFGLPFDVAPTASVFLTLSTEARVSPGLAAVTLGAHAVAYVSATGCRACFANAAASSAPNAIELDPVMLGSLAALAAQRLLLDLPTESVGVISAGPDGLPANLPVTRCPEHEHP